MGGMFKHGCFSAPGLAYGHMVFLSPVGTNDNSPVVYRWVTGTPVYFSPIGTIEKKYIVPKAGELIQLSRVRYIAPFVYVFIF